MNICIIGCGTIGRSLAEYAESEPKVEKIFLADHNMELTRRFAGEFSGAEAVAHPRDVIDETPLFLEAASADAVREYGSDILGQGRDLLIMSVGALADRELLADLLMAAELNHSHIHLPSGALGGLDALNSAAIGKVERVTLTTTKPPGGLRGNDHLMEKGIDVDRITTAEKVFDGSAAEAIKYFPLNINVAVCLSLVGIGLKQTRVKMIVDPYTSRNTHRLLAMGEFGELECVVKNVPSKLNPRTSNLAAFSAAATLQKILSPIKIGT